MIETHDHDSRGKFKKGNSQRFGEGHPSGKDAKRGSGNSAMTKSITACLKEVAREFIPEGHKFYHKYKGKKWNRAFAERMFEFILAKGNPGLVKEVIDRIDGPVKHEVEIQGNVSSQHEHEIARRVKAKLEELRKELQGEVQNE